MLHKEPANVDFTRQDVLYIIELINHRETHLKQEAINLIEQEENGEITKEELDSSLASIHDEQTDVETLRSNIMKQIKEQLYK
ncbi:hypothetical protein [Priestia megaterium]|uniref:hypothetical protein n=1 Tax=Priestia megaterium TaxID=1404 RepID=UPI0023DB029B|nr:hypothetical protein [Priestia megaterium]MDF2010220.1 hypothetical protein [Priestia megaterium]